MGAVLEIAEHVGEVVASDVLHEAIEELSGRSARRWALVLLAAVAGATLAVLVVKWYRDRTPAESA